MKALQSCMSGLTIAVVLAGAALLGGDVMSRDVASQQKMLAVSPAQSAWQEIKWPFLMDQWGIGRAFRCGVADCGAELRVYVRAKIGFCNCTTGVSDDEEIDRIGDAELIGTKYRSVAPGAAATVAGMKGRLRRYEVAGNRSSRTTLVVAFAQKCDVMVATAVTESGSDAPSEVLVLQFLNGDVISGWAVRDLGA